MLGKLLKHEFRATGRLILPMYAVVLLVSLFAHFAFRMLDRGLPVFLGLLLYLIVAAFFIGLIGAFVYTFVVMIVRFKRNVLSDEGYLTMTLPVSIHSILWAKIIVSLVWSAATVLIAALSVVIAAFEVGWVVEALKDLGYLFELFFSYDDKASVLGWMLSIALYAVVSGIVGCLNIYSCMTIGYGFARNKVLWSIVAYFIISIILGWIGGGSLQVLVSLNENVFTSETFNESFYQNFTLLFGSQLLYGVIFYVLTWWNLRYRLNLE
ncbi:MAG: hypothetical protein IJ788_08190 [Oscillospiraceae bacterium]|nr:hypothetical protein [Oscillospiraceae bacterium]